MLYFNPATNTAHDSRDGTAAMECRLDWPTLASATVVAALLNGNPDQAGTWLATDEGENVSPRYDVARLPEVGAPVSAAFNGDSYPDGEVASVSPTGKLVVTTNGSHYYRVRQTGSWRKERTWWLIGGHVSKQNPSF